MLHALIHSSKTMGAPATPLLPLSSPRFFGSATELATMWHRADHEALQRLMKLSPKKAAEVSSLFATWSADPHQQTPAIDTFRGDIYSGLQVATWSEADRHYAHHNLTILSGLYGALRACDGIMPYRLEMGYRLPDGRSIYDYWGARLTENIPPDTTHLLNLSALEYTKALLPFTDLPVITPRFLTISQKNAQPTFVVVHAKVARGAFASWVIRHRISAVEELSTFNTLGYTYDEKMSTSTEPVFVCQKFQGIGLSVRSQGEKP